MKKQPKARWSRDPDCGCWRYTAPDGYTFAQDLHEMVYGFEAWTAKEARADAKERERFEPLEPCEKRPKCDWCDGARLDLVHRIEALRNRPLAGKWALFDLQLAEEALKDYDRQHGVTT